jgi:methyl-accepting chemotaxis protein
MPPLDLDRFELDSDDDDDIDQWCNDFGNIGLPVQRIVQNVSRSLDEIMELEVRIIQSCTDLEPATWIAIYAERFRSIMDENSSGTESQIKRKLYFNE